MKSLVKSDLLAASPETVADLMVYPVFFKTTRRIWASPSPSFNISLKESVRKDRPKVATVIASKRFVLPIPFGPTIANIPLVKGTLQNG